MNTKTSIIIELRGMANKSDCAGLCETGESWHHSSA